MYAFRSYGSTLGQRVHRRFYNVARLLMCERCGCWCCSVQPNKKRKLADVESLSGSLGRNFLPPSPCVDAATLHSVKHEPVYSDTPFGPYKDHFPSHQLVSATCWKVVSVLFVTTSQKVGNKLATCNPRRPALYSGRDLIDADVHLFVANLRA